MHTDRNHNGFTLIELMIVIVVLDILAGIVLFGIGTFQGDAEKARDGANSRQCQTAIAAYKASHDGNAPTAPADIAPYFSGTAPDCGL